MTEELWCQKAIDYLNEHNVKVHLGTPPYKILYKLAKVKGIDMNGSANQIRMGNNLSEKSIKSLALNCVKEFCETGLLIVPNVFKYRKRNNYKHDGDSTANRNLWKESNPASKHRKKVTYNNLNTKKK